MQTKLDRTIQALGAHVLGDQRSLSQRVALARGIFRVAQMMTALDGRILPFEELAVKRLFAEYGSVLSFGGLPGSVHADVLIQLRQEGADDARLAEKFAELAVVVLPPGFLDNGPFDARFAFVLWLAMSLSDGTFDAVERLAYGRLLDRLVPRPEWIRPGEARPSDALLAFRADLEDFLARLAGGDAAAVDAAFDGLLEKCGTLPEAVDGPAVAVRVVSGWGEACGGGSEPSDMRRRQLLDAEHPSVHKVVFRVEVAGGETLTLSAQELLEAARRRLCGQEEPATRALWLRIREAVRKVDGATADYMVPRCEYRDGLCHELRIRPCNRCPGGYPA